LLPLGSGQISGRLWRSLALIYARHAPSSWSGTVQITLAAKASNNGDRLDAKQIDFNSPEMAGSVMQGGNGNDQLWGKAGWDILDGSAGNDLIRAGNGRDILIGGLGADELHGDFGWNTYKSEQDGFSDLIAIKSDQYLVNWIYGKAGNNSDGAKCDIIEGLDAIDKIKIIGVATRDITFAANVTTKGLTGIGIYGNGALEALYTGGDLSLTQIQAMTTGDTSAAAMANQISSYSTW
jgi:Ca2+-binding RTX toxin-like protein